MAAVDGAGFVHAAAFVDAAITDSQLNSQKEHWDTASFMALPRGADSVVLRSRTLVVAGDSATGFGIVAYANERHLQLIQVFAPVVNGHNDWEVAQMIATVDSVGSALTDHVPGIAAWIQQSMRDAWQAYGRPGQTAADAIRERRVGDYRLVVSGVPPDLVFFGAIRDQRLPLPCLGAGGGRHSQTTARTPHQIQPMPGASADPDPDTRREYALQTSQEISYLSTAALCLGGGAYCLVLASDPAGRWLAVAIAILCMIPGYVLLASALRSRVVIEGDRLELHSALRVRAVHRDDVGGLQRLANGSGHWTRLFLTRHHGVVTISAEFTGNNDLNEWLKGVPDLDEQRANEIMHTIDTRTGISGRFLQHDAGHGYRRCSSPSSGQRSIHAPT